MIKKKICILGVVVAVIAFGCGQKSNQQTTPETGGGELSVSDGGAAEVNCTDSTAESAETVNEYQTADESAIPIESALTPKIDPALVNAEGEAWLWDRNYRSGFVFNADGSYLNIVSGDDLSVGWCVAVKGKWFSVGDSLTLSGPRTTESYSVHGDNFTIEEILSNGDISNVVYKKRSGVKIGANIRKCKFHGD